ncbi:MAG: hypothetical protein E7501_07195 [Ruminococcus sp.]|nr:hypothetical protein [Ruminococcus sp.]MBQ8906856.1 hypothetical protein [Ruminococcus sp.]
METILSNLIVILILLAIAGAIILYLYKAKQRGETCIGCPYAKQCGGTCSGGCNGTNADHHKKDAE